MDKSFAQQLKKIEQSSQQKTEQEPGNGAVASTGAGIGTEAKKFPKGVVLGKDGKP